jgi:hypothetical protein
VQTAAFQTVQAQQLASGSTILTDQPSPPKTLKEIPQPSNDSSLLLNDLSTTNLDAILRKREVKLDKPIFVQSPLERGAGRSYGLVTAEHLGAGEILQTQFVRLFKPEAGINDDLFANQSNQIVYGLTDDIELSLDLQGVNGSVPGFQGNFTAERRVGINNGNVFQDFSLLGKLRVGTILGGQSSLVLGLTASRPQFTFTTTDPATGLSVQTTRPQSGITLAPSLELPITYKTKDDRLSFTVSPRLVYFPEDSNLYTPVNPGSNGRFGLTVALGLGGTYKLSPRFQIRGDASPILVGNNTVGRFSGQPTQVIPFNIGLRYLVNPRIALDVFATNTFGNSGGPAIAAFSNNTGIGVALTTTPERLFTILDVPANRKFAETFYEDVPKERRRIFVPASFDLLDGSTIARETSQIALRVSTGTIGAAFRNGSLDDFETGFFANFAPEGVDESDAGASTKIRFLHQQSGDPFTLSALVTLGRSSSRLCNFINGTRDGLERAINGQPTNCPGVPGSSPAGDRGPIPANLFGLVTENIGELIILTLSLPTQFTFDSGASLWFNPKLAYIQRAGDRSPLIGASFGASYPVMPGLELVGQITPVFRGENAFLGDGLARLLPWQAGVRFSLPNGFSANLYATNAVGLSPYESLRVRADNQVSVGLGLQLPF